YELGAWILPVLRVLAKLKRLRGTKLDIFAYGADRKLERALLGDYESLLERFAAELDEDRFEIALELARLPSQIRGYGPIKRRAAEQAATVRQRLLDQWSAPKRLERPAAPRERATAA